MLLQKRIQNEQEQFQSNQISEGMLQLSEKEEALISSLCSLQYDETNISMLIMKSKFLQEECNKVISSITESRMDPGVKQVQILTVSNMQKRISDITGTLENARITIRESNSIENAAVRQRIINNIAKDIERVRAEGEAYG